MLPNRRLKRKACGRSYNCHTGLPAYGLRHGLERIDYNIARPKVGGDSSEDKSM